MKWFRMYHGASSHKKWTLIARKSGQPVSIVGMTAWALMEKGSKAIPRGNVTEFEADEYAAYLGVDEECVEAVIKALVDKKWIEDGILTTWEENNPKSDYSTERVRKHRKHKKAVTETDETVTETKGTKSNGLDKIREDSKKKIYKRKVSLPEGFPFEHDKELAITYWQKNKRLDLDVETQSELFIAWAQKNGKQFLDWHAAFRTWYVNAKKFNKPELVKPKHNLLS